MRHTIVKRDSQIEYYEPAKLHHSIKSSVLSARGVVGEAELVATKVLQHVETWLHIHEEVTSADLRRKASEALSVYHPDASYLYTQNRIMA